MNGFQNWRYLWCNHNISVWQGLPKSQISLLLWKCVISDGGLPYFWLDDSTCITIGPNNKNFRSKREKHLSIPKIKLLRNLYLLENEVDLECCNITFNKHAFCNNAKGTKLRPLYIGVFDSSLVVCYSCRTHVCWTLDCSTPDPTSFSNICNDLFSECSIHFP